MRTTPPFPPVSFRHAHLLTYFWHVQQLDLLVSSPSTFLTLLRSLHHKRVIDSGR